MGDGNWAGEVIGYGRFVGDAEQFVDRRTEIAGTDGEVDWISGLLVACAVDVAGFHGTTGEQRETALRPVIATGGFVDLGRAAHVAAHHDERRVPQTFCL